MAEATVRLRLEGGEEGEALRLEGDRLWVRVPLPWAVGQPVAFTARLDLKEVALRGRCQRARRIGATGYEARVRLVGLTRSQREALASLLVSTGS